MDGTYYIPQNLGMNGKKNEGRVLLDMVEEKLYYKYREELSQRHLEGSRLKVAVKGDGGDDGGTRVEEKREEAKRAPGNQEGMRPCNQNGTRETWGRRVKLRGWRGSL